MLRLTPLERPLVSPPEQGSFRRLVVGLFGFRRKQLARGLRELTGWEPVRVVALLGRLGVPQMTDSGYNHRLRSGILE